MLTGLLTSYVVRRIGAAIITMVAASAIIFAFIHLIPGDPLYVLLGDGATPDQANALRAKLGLDQPIHVQYFTWLAHVLQGDLGTSLFFQTPVLEVIADGAETSILLALITMIWVVLIGIPIGMIAATRQGTPGRPGCVRGGNVLRIRPDILGRALFDLVFRDLARLAAKFGLPLHLRRWRSCESALPAPAKPCAGGAKRSPNPAPDAVEHA